MDLFGILFLVFLVVLFFTFIYCLVKSAKKLGWIHSILVVFLFIETIVFMMATAGVLRRRVGWIELHHSLSKKVEAAEKESVDLKYGDLTNPALDITKLYPLQNTLGRLVLDRGRVWSSARVVQNQGNNVQLNLVQFAAAPAGDEAVPADPNAPAAAAPTTGDSLKVETIVYVFAEKGDESGRFLPSAYLGEFVVTENQAGLVTIAPTLRSPQYATLAQTSDQWSLFELMPLDSHEAFVEVGSTKSEDELFGHVDAEKINAILAGVPEASRQAIIDSYVRDGKAANENDPPEVVWQRVEFTKEHSIDVDSLQESTVLDGGYFDDLGRTVDSRLKRGEGKAVIQFKAGDQIDFISKFAEDLIAKDVAKVIKRYYVRQLNDYDDGFRIVDRRNFEVTERIAYIQRETAVLNEAYRVSQETIGGRQIEIANLKKEQTQYAKELEVVNSEFTRLTDDLQKTRAQLSELFRTNQGLYQELIAESQRLKQMAGPGLAAVEDANAK